MRICIGYGTFASKKLICCLLLAGILLISLSLNVSASSVKKDTKPSIGSSSNQSQLYERGEDWDDYLNPDGTHTRKIYTGLRYYWNGSGYEPIDTTIVYS